MRQNKTVKTMAFLALLGIIISVVGTGILVLTTPKQIETYQVDPNNITQEELQKILDNNKAEIKTLTGKTETLTGKIETSTGIIDLK